MQRDSRAYLIDIVEACDAITAALRGIDVEAFRASRLIRSAVEREFILIGEAIGSLSRSAPEVVPSISNARRIVDFRNQLTHEYSNVNDALVWGIADRDVPVLRRECAQILDSMGDLG